MEKDGIKINVGPNSTRAGSPPEATVLLLQRLVNWATTHNILKCKMYTFGINSCGYIFIFTEKWISPIDSFPSLGLGTDIICYKVGFEFIDAVLIFKNNKEIEINKITDERIKDLIENEFKGNQNANTGLFTLRTEGRILKKRFVSLTGVGQKFALLCDTPFLS